MSQPVEVRILDKVYLVGCPEDEREPLQAAARLLDERLRGMRAHNRLESLERIAVLAALNLAHERLQAQGQAAERERQIASTVDGLQRRLDSALAGAGLGG